MMLRTSKNQNASKRIEQIVLFLREQMIQKDL